MPLHDRSPVRIAVGALLAVAASAVVSDGPVRAATLNRSLVLHASLIVADGQGTTFLRSIEGLGNVALRSADSRETSYLQQGEVRLVRGLTDDREWWDWRQAVVVGHGRQARHDVSIVLLDDTGAEFARWEVKDAWPRSLTVSLSADGVAQEELVLAHGPVTLVNPAKSTP